ncbi:MAG TPA: hypothetical protein VFO39_03815 [Candidatus Sulfotelmatobacter sp.]|nr:hypothetical protein [Candidatus Sulfotelmatobacter sp.]
MKEAVATLPQFGADRATVRRFVDLAVRGLVPMFDGQRQLFCYKLKKADQCMVQQGFSPRYTMMTLMGLHRLEQAGGRSPFDHDGIVNSLLSDLAWVNNLGDMGVLLWLCATVCPERLEALEPQLNLETALRHFKDARHGLTMELSWFLTGLAYWAQVSPAKSAELEPLAFAAYKSLTENQGKNQGKNGFFSHLSISRSLAGLLRGRFGTFADQVYPIYAMAQFSRAYGHEEAAVRASQCALGICEAQGRMGQWWWHYDSAGGRVANGYPVFSVHQHAMAPMTLFGLADVVNQNFDEYIYKGLRWINANNELAFNMEDPAHGVIWRCIEESGSTPGKYVKAGFGRYSETIEEKGDGLKVLFECRPYELGWLLYAFANRAE